MTKKVKKKETKDVNKSGAEKPVSLWGASFTEVIAALLKTKPKPKEESKEDKKKDRKGKV
jgi:hypothetical protein